MAEIEKKWYVLRAISGKEAKVKEYLEADLKNSDLGEYDGWKGAFRRRTGTNV